MNKVSLYLSVLLIAIMGCSASDMQKTLSQGLGLSPSQEDKANDSKIDIEDQNCLTIRYDKRSVCRMQVHLNSLGYNVGKADGIAGQNTQQAIRQFQAKHNMNPQDGKPSYDVLTELRLKNSGQVSAAKTAVYSAASCAVLAKLFKKDVATWAMICGVGGAVVQSMSNSGKQEYALRYYEIKDENERSENEVNQLVKQVEQNNSKISFYKSEINTLVANEKNDKLFISKASVLSKQIDEQSRKNQHAKGEAEIKVAILEDQIDDMNFLLAEKPSEEDFTKTIASLQTKKSSLIQTIEQSNSIERELLAQKDTLDDEIAKRS